MTTTLPRHRSFLLSALFAVSLFLTPAALAEAPSLPATSHACTKDITVYLPEAIPIVGVDPQSQQAKDLVHVYNDLLKASNEHNITEILKLYNPKFISGDNLNLEQLKSMIQETWQSYPGICYQSKPLEIRVHGDWATIESLDHSYATAPPDKDVINVPGKMVSHSRSQLFLRRIGSSWEIMSDATIWEEATIRYGLADDLKIVLSAPEQVKAGETYSATIQANLPEGTFTLATIDNEPTIYPHQKIDDKFRALNNETNQLQRVLRANTTNHNEIVTATLGLTTVEQSNPERPSLSLSGIATIVKRVNVVPISAEDVMAEMKKQELVRTSANGKFNFSDQTSSPNNANNVAPKTPVNGSLEVQPLESSPAKNGRSEEDAED